MAENETQNQEQEQTVSENHLITVREIEDIIIETVNEIDGLAVSNLIKIIFDKISHRDGCSKRTIRRVIDSLVTSGFFTKPKVDVIHLTVTGRREAERLLGDD